MIQPTELLEYQADLFVNRIEEVAEVMARIDEQIVHAHSQNPSGSRTTIIQGEHGMGKSWLLTHLFHLLKQEGRAFQAFLDLDDYRNFSTPEEAVEAIWYKLYQLLLDRTFELPINLDQLHRYMIKEFREYLLSQRPLVLLIDSVYEAEWELLKILEEYLLAPIIVQQGVILVMAGRGKPYPWIAPELRLRAHFMTLQPFNAPHIERQLALQLPASLNLVAHIYDISRGNPKTAYLIGETGNDLSALNQIINDMLTYLPEEERSAIRSSAESLCITNRFDLKLATALFQNYMPSERPRQRRDVLTLIDNLVEAGLVLWSKELRAYTFYDSTHHLLRQYMQHGQPVAAIELHQIALNFYQAWVDAQPPNWERWQKEVNYHSQCLNELRRQLST